MQLTYVLTPEKRETADVILLPFWQGKGKGVPAFSAKEFASYYAFPLEKGDFLGKEGECLLLYPSSSKGKEGRLLLLGLGKKEECTEEQNRRSYAGALRFCRKNNLQNLNVLFPEQEKRFTSAALEGMLLANYAFDKLKGDSLKENPTILVKKLTLVGVAKSFFEEEKQNLHITDAVNFVRDLVNGNADDVTPQMLAKTAQELAKKHPAIKTTIFDKKRIEKEKMGLLLAVNRGSTRDPAFIVLEYKGDPSSSKSIALVGKGITYDTGGLNLKPTGSMETMKDDMSGAAAVLGTFMAAAALRLKVNLVGAIASTENAIGPNSYKPGDVYLSYAGKSVEIANTDAEGRLVLADALAYLQKHYSPTIAIDLATLTGAIVIALGEGITGLFCNDDALAKALIAAGQKSCEKVWRMPLLSEYKEGLKSPIADLKNCGDRKGGSIVAALFLEHFIEKNMPWAHLDIAGSAFLSHPKIYHPTQATGVGVRLLITLLRSFEISGINWK